MLLAIDIGNTNTVFALCDDKAVHAHWRISTDHRRTADEYAVWLLALMQQRGFTKDKVDSIAIASVVPDAIFNLKSLSRQLFGKEPLILGNGAVALDMQVKIDQPKELGADRLVNAYAAWNKHKVALVVVDFGTATTFDVVSPEGNYIGGVIAPGVNLSLEALQNAAARLPGVAIAHPAKVIGTNTTGAMQSGIYFGYLALIDGIVARIAEEMGTKPKVIATGGLAPLYAAASDTIDEVDEDLTIEGIRLIAARLAQKA
jgi:type III pantothenate kinase